MTDSNPNPTPTSTPKQRKRLTADELIAIVIALVGIGTVFFWGIGQQKNSPMNLVQGNIAPVNGKGGELIESEPNNVAKERKPIASLPAQIASPSPVATAPVVTAPVAPVAESPQPATAEVAVVPPVAVVPAPAPSPVAVAPEFKDVPKDFWGEGYIAELQKRGILNDFGEGKFDPTKPITRGEYAKILNRAFPDKPAITPALSFKDIPANYPRKDAIDRAVITGFMSGY
jgi:hypothetical protein